MTKFDLFQKLLLRYKWAYLQCNSNDVEVTYNRGWVTINGSKYRLSVFEKAVETLELRAKTL